MSVTLTITEYNHLRDSLTISNNTVAKYKKGNDDWSSECERLRKKRDEVILKNNDVVKKYKLINTGFDTLFEKNAELTTAHNELKLKYEKKTTAASKYTDLLEEFRSLSIEHEILLKQIKDKEEEDSESSSETEEEESEEEEDS